MARRVMVALIVGLVLAAASAWALSEGDGGGVWIQAPFQQKIQVTNILSRELGVDPAKLQQCLEKTFGDPANTGKTIREAARQCKENKP
jgi:hypothetical protein